MRVVFMGTAEFACPSLAALDESPGIEVVGVVTQPDRPKGRELIPHPPQSSSRPSCATSLSTNRNGCAATFSISNKSRQA